MQLFTATVAIPAQPFTAHRLERLGFGENFISANKPFWVNQLDAGASVIWDAALSRLLYHIAVFVTEGISANLWQDDAQQA